MEFKTQIYRLRKILIVTYKRYETPILYVLRFILGLVVISAINGFFKELGAPYATKLTSTSAVLLAAIVTAIATPVWFYLICALFITYHVFCMSLELSIIIGLLLICLILFYIRIFPKESMLIVMLLICFKFKIPYFAILFAGLFAPVSSIGAMIIGAFLWKSLPIFETMKGMGQTLANVSVLDLPQSFSDVFKGFLDSAVGNEQFVGLALAFTITIVAMRIMRSLPINYTLEIALGVGTVTLLMAMMLANTGFGFFGVFMSTVFSALLALLCKFFYIIVDYQKTERVTFSDEDYLYYVKAVPRLGNDED